MANHITEQDLPPPWESYEDELREVYEDHPDLDNEDDVVFYRVWISTHYEERHENVR
jgi:hypothetical protein